jgi:tetratricopeptide (TPR) repeat protein
MRQVPLLACLCALSLAAVRPGGLSSSTGQLRGPSSPAAGSAIEQLGQDRLVRLEQWVKAVARHAPGEDDDALREVAAWPNTALKLLWIDANVLTQMIRSVNANRLTVRPEGQRTGTQVRYSSTQTHRLRVLACAAGGALVQEACMAIGAGSELAPELRQLAVLVRTATLRGDDNYILRRGALLHADVAILAPRSMEAAGDVGRSSGGLERLRMEISDGQEVNLHQSAVHWEIARMLLDFVRPRGVDHADPGHDEMVRKWYRATAAWMQLSEDHDRLHLDRARAIFPADPDILFLSACQRETYAGVPIQTAVRSAILPTGVTLDVGSERTELREAEGLFRRLLEIRSDHAEARLRYGRVLGALGKHAEAAVELRRAVADLTDRQLLYYAELFLGGEEEALGNRDAARVAYEQAAEISPMAQSPLLALSQLARRHADRRGALRAIERLFALSVEERTGHDDPWWDYYVVQARDANDLLQAMEQPFLMERLH